MEKQLLWKRSLVFILALLLVFPNLNMARVQASGGNLTVESAVAENLDGNLNSVIYANGKYTAVGEGGKIIQSADGMNWAPITVPFSNAKISWRSIAFTSSTYVVAGVDYTNSSAKAKLIVSTDGGGTWTDKSTAVTADVLQNVRYLNGAFYAVGGRWSASARAQDLGVIYSSADGQNWSQWSTTACFWPSGSTISTPFYLTDISYFNGKYVVTGNVFAGYAYSGNGTGWTTRFLSGLSNSYGLDSLSVYNGKLYVSHSWNEGFVSSDGMAFTADSSYNRTLGAVQAGSLLYRFGRAGEMYSSTNGGATWTAADSVTNHTIRSAASNGTGMVLITTSSQSLVVTPDRVTWKRLGSNLQGIAYNGSTWGVTGNISSNDSVELPDGFILSSSSGWNQLSTADNLLPAQGLSKIAYGNNLFVAAGKKVGVSADAQTWTISDLPAGAAGPVTGLAYGTSGFVAVTKGDKILTSANGTSWSVAATYSGASFYNVKYVNGVYVAFGYGGVWSSVNGTSWSSLNSLVTDYQQSSSFYSIYDVTYANGKYIVVVTNGNDGFPHVLETTGALSSNSVWTDYVIDGSSNWTELYSIDYGNGIYVAAGTMYDNQNFQHHVAYSSSDLQTWTKYDEQTLGVSGGGLSQVVYQNNKFYIVGNGNTKIVLGSGGTVETTPAAVIDYTAEQLTGLTANGSYTVNGNVVTADGSGKLAMDSSWLGTSLSIVKKGDGSTTTDSTAQTLNVPSRPAAPSSVGKTNETAVNANNGSLTNVTAAMEYKKGTTGAWSDVTGTSVTGLAPDTYYIRTKATTTTFASASVQVTVGAFTATPETTPAAVIDYTAEQLTGLTANGSYTVNGNVVTATADGKLAMDSSWLGTSLSIVKKGDGSTTTDSTAQTLNVPSRPAAPSSVGKTNETAVNANNGSLTNVTAAMEYKKGTTGAWSDVTGTSVTGLAPDTYYIRTKATTTTFASASVQVTVGAFTATPETTPAAVIDYTAEQLTGLTANGSYTVNGNVVTADGSGKLAMDSSWLGTSLSIVKKGDGSTTTDSTAQTLNVPSRPAAPVGVTVTDITYGGANNGSIQNVTLQMEYKKGSAGPWINVEDTAITHLAPDTYYIRVKATLTSFASIALQVTVHDSNAVIPAAPEVTADDQNNAIVGLDTSMEFAVDDESYVRYDGTNLPDLSGDHIVKVRVAASGSLPAGPATVLTFTESVPVPSGGLYLSASDPSGTGNNGKTHITVTPAPAAGHNYYYKNFGTGSAVVPNVGDILTGYTLVGSDGLVPAANGERIGIAEVDASGKVVKYGSVIAVVVAETVTPGTDPGNTNGNTGGTTSGTGVITEVIVLVNGKQENAGTATTITSGTVKTTTIVVDPSKLQAKLDMEGNGAVITIPVTQDSNIFVGELNGQMIKNMENVSSTLVLQTNNASYILPAKEINIGAMAQQFGTGVKLEDIKLKITIGETSTTMSQVITGAASRGGFTLIAPALDFTITGTYGNSTVEISRFNAYVKRTVALPDGIDPNRITTGIVVDPDGTVRHVPTKIILKDGKYYAELNSLTNSSYSVVWHPLTFADVENHWAKDAVNDMGSRMVINGVNETTFNPNSDITRAEFAAIIVRGLGLKLGEGKTAFADVPAVAWYAGAVETASEYGLITGFEDGTFRPDAKITREQAMNIIAKAMKPTGLADRTGAADAESILASFIDAGSVGNWAKDSLALAVKAGLISGRSGNKLEAKSNVTRAEVAVLIQRLLQKSDLTN
ncbi:Endo-1,4-beta-xylanase A precursor [compost metagenome]